MSVKKNLFVGLGASFVGLVASLCDASTTSAAKVKNNVKEKSLNVAFVDVRRAYTEYNKAKKDQEGIKILVGDFEKEGKNLYDAAQKLGIKWEELNKKLKNPTLSDAAKADLEKEIKSTETSLQAAQHKVQEHYQTGRANIYQKQQASTGDRVAEIEKEVSLYAEKKNLDLVLRKESCIYFKPKSDITDEIIKILNPVENSKGKEKAKKTAK